MTSLRTEKLSFVWRPGHTEEWQIKGTVDLTNISVTETTGMVHAWVFIDKRLRFSWAADFRKSCQQQWRQSQFWWLYFTVADLLVFGLKPLKLLGSINWCKSINFFCFVLIYGRTKLRLLFDVMRVVFFFLILPSCLFGLWFFGSFFDDIEWRKSIVISPTWMCTLEKHAVELLNA